MLVLEPKSVRSLFENRGIEGFFFPLLHYPLTASVAFRERDRQEKQGRERERKKEILQLIKTIL